MSHGTKVGRERRVRVWCWWRVSSVVLMKHVTYLDQSCHTGVEGGKGKPLPKTNRRHLQHYFSSIDEQHDFSSIDEASPSAHTSSFRLQSVAACCSACCCVLQVCCRCVTMKWAALKEPLLTPWPLACSVLQHVPICCSVLPVPEPIPLPRIDSDLSRIYIYKVGINKRVTLRSGSKLRHIYQWLMSHTPESHVWVMRQTAHKWHLTQRRKSTLDAKTQVMSWRKDASHVK